MTRIQLIDTLRMLGQTAKFHANTARHYRESAAQSAGLKDFYEGMAKLNEGRIAGIRTACHFMAFQKRF